MEISPFPGIQDAALYIPRVSRSQQATDRDMTNDYETDDEIDEITTGIQVSLRRLGLDGLSFIA